MTEESFSKAKDPLDLDPDAPDPEAEREGHAWGRICRAKGVNSDMLVRTAHTDASYVFVVDRAKAMPPAPTLGA